jgi:hypothetical protein
MLVYFDNLLAMMGYIIDYFWRGRNYCLGMKGIIDNWN